MTTNHTLKSITLGIGFVLCMAGTGIAADLYTLPTEDGMELFLLDSKLQTPSLDMRGTAQTSLTIGEMGDLTFKRPDSLTKHIGSGPTVTTAESGYRGFRTSPLGRVLSVEGQFQPDLGVANVETATSQLPERKFDLGSPQTERGGWQNGQGLRILSF